MGTLAPRVLERWLNSWTEVAFPIFTSAPSELRCSAGFRVWGFFRLRALVCEIQDAEWKPRRKVLLNYYWITIKAYLKVSPQLPRLACCSEEEALLRQHRFRPPALSRASYSFIFRLFGCQPQEVSGITAQALADHALKIKSSNLED